MLDRKKNQGNKAKTGCNIDTYLANLKSSGSCFWPGCRRCRRMTRPCRRECFRLRSESSPPTSPSCRKACAADSESFEPEESSFRRSLPDSKASFRSSNFRPKKCRRTTDARSGRTWRTRGRGGRRVEPQPG